MPRFIFMLRLSESMVGSAVSVADDYARLESAAIPIPGCETYPLCPHQPLCDASRVRWSPSPHTSPSS